MTFQFPENNTEPFDFGKLLNGRNDFSPEYIQNMNSARQRMCDALASQPASQAVIDTIEAYLPYLQYVLRQDDQGEIGEKKGSKFTWRSALSKGIRMSLSSSIVEKPMVSLSSIWFEASNVLLSLGYALANMANRQVGSFAAATESSCAEGADLLCRAAGVFKLAAQSWLPRWRNKKGVPPECNVELLSVLSELMIADANKLALLKAQHRGMSPTTLVRLGVVTMQRYEQCVLMLRRLRKVDFEELSDPFVSYVEDGARIAEALVLKRYAEIKHEEGNNGTAVACITQAYNDLVKCLRAEWAQHKKTSNSMLAEYDELRTRYVRINNNVTYQRILDINEVKAEMPTGCAIAEIKNYLLPDIVESTKVEINSNQNAGEDPCNSRN